MNLKISKVWKRKEIWSVLLLMAVAVFFRLWMLGEGSIHPDGIIHDVCRMNVSAVDVLNNWESYVGQTGQLPVIPAMTKAFINLFHLEPTVRNVILPSAFWSFLSVLAFFGLGRKAGGFSFGLILMAIAALNPLYVQMGREAYFYPTSVLGAVLSLWAMLLGWDSFDSGKPFSLRFYLMQAAALFFLLYSSAGGWPFAVVVALFLFGGLVWRCWKLRRISRDLVFLALLYLAFGLPVLLAPWGLQAILRTQQGAAREYGAKIFEMSRNIPVLPKLAEELLRLSWGRSPWRCLFSIGVFLSGFSGIFILGRKNRRWWLLGGLFPAYLAISIISLKSSSWGLDIHRIAAVWVLVFLILAVGLWWPFSVFRRNKRLAVLGSMPCVIAAIFWLHSDILVLKMNGHPIPYQQIAQWLDRNLPEGTPVITERYYTAGTWFHLNPATNVCMVSTVPNELPEIQEKTHFREVTRQFFEANPAAAFFQENHMYERPEVVPWMWPDTFFTHTKVFVDEAARELWLMGQNYRADSSMTEESLCRTVYYNLPKDVIIRARTEGRPSTVFFSKGWKVVQTRDYRLWRMMQNYATIEVWNLSDVPQQASLTIQAVAAGGAKQIIFNGSEKKVFPSGQVTVWTSRFVTLAPGKNLLTLRDPLQTSQVPLLIASLEVNPAKP